MSAQAIQYAIAKSSINKDSLKCYYDFSHSGLFIAKTGATGPYYMNMKNIYPAANTGSNPATILAYSRAFGNTGLLPLGVTGTAGFLYKNNSGDFTKSNLLISGNTNINYNDFSALFRISNSSYYRGIIMGCFEKTIDTVLGQDYIGSKGFNFGINDRGHLFFQSLKNDGEYVLTASSIELSNTNLVSLSVGNGSIDIAAFDYINEKYNSQSFLLDTTYIKNPNTGSIFIGNTKTFFEKANPYVYTSFGGYITNILLFSGKVPQFGLYNVGSGVIGDYFYQQTGTTTITGQLTGYDRVFQSLSGVIGWTTGITGYRTMQLDYSIPTGRYTLTTSTSQKEGATGMFLINKIFNNRTGQYIEMRGLLTGNLMGTYNPTGYNAFDTLGLTDSNVIQPRYIFNSGYKTGSYQMPLYGPVAISGVTGTILLSETPLYQTTTTTGYASGISINQSSFDYKKDYIYFLGERL